MSQPTLLSRIQGCLVGVALGDAMGMPVETMTRSEIMKLNDGKGVVGFMDACQTRLDTTAHLQKGQTTDDWQLTRAIAKSLIKCEKYDFEDMVKAQIAEMDASTFGWGRTTEVSLREVKDFYESGGQSGRDPKIWPSFENKGKGCGNGVAMKVAPLAIYAFFKEQDFLKNGELAEIILEQGLLTHPDTRATIAAFALALALKVNFNYNFCGLLSIAPDWNIQFLTLIGQTMIFEIETKHSWVVDHNEFQVLPMFTLCLNKLKRVGIDDYEKLIVDIGVSSFSLHSIPFSFGIAWRNPFNFRNGILEAVNAGGDTDTNGSMVGALIGSVVGLEGIPTEWIDQCPSAQEAIELGTKLFNSLSEK